MRNAQKQSKISAAFFAGTITRKQAAKLARKAKRQAARKARQS